VVHVSGEPPPKAALGQVAGPSWQERLREIVSVSAIEATGSPLAIELSITDYPYAGAMRLQAKLMRPGAGAGGSMVRCRGIGLSRGLTAIFNSGKIISRLLGI
jgi:hypothetical protein